MTAVFTHPTGWIDAGNDNATHSPHLDAERLPALDDPGAVRKLWLEATRVAYLDAADIIEQQAALLIGVPVHVAIPRLAKSLRGSAHKLAREAG